MKEYIISSKTADSIQEAHNFIELLIDEQDHWLPLNLNKVLDILALFFSPHNAQYFIPRSKLIDLFFQAIAMEHSHSEDSVIEH